MTSKNVVRALRWGIGLLAGGMLLASGCAIPGVDQVLGLFGNLFGNA